MRTIQSRSLKLPPDADGHPWIVGPRNSFFVPIDLLRFWVSFWGGLLCFLWGCGGHGDGNGIPLEDTSHGFLFQGGAFRGDDDECEGKGVSGELVRFEQPIKGHGSLSFLVIGDWGRRGDYNQSEVASQMGRIGEDLGIDFVVSAGDNFYDDGLTGEHDPNFEESFSRICTAKSLQKPWYSVLGNHDYRGNVEAQLSPVIRKVDSRWICWRSFVVNAELVEIFFVDTTRFVVACFMDFEDHTYDWRGIKSRGAYLRSLLKDVDSALKSSPAKWKIVVGHHAVRSISHHGDTPELVKRLLPILWANDVDFYINGHVHCLQQIADTESQVQFVTSGVEGLEGRHQPAGSTGREILS